MTKSRAPAAVAAAAERAIRTRYEALLPKYGNLWRSMAPKTAEKREPLSLLSAIENGLTISMQVPSKCNECPLDSTCQGCVDPIIEIENEGSPSSQSSASSEDTAPVRFDLSNIRLDDDGESSENGRPLTDPVADQESGFDMVHTSQSFRDPGHNNDGSTAPSASESEKDDSESDGESIASSSSASSESMKGWDLSGLRLEDKDESTSETRTTATRKENHASQVIDLLDDSDSDISSNTSLKASSFKKKARNLQEGHNAFASRPTRVVLTSDSSGEEEWDDRKPSAKDDDSIESNASNRSPSVIVLGDSDDALDDSMLDSDEESIGGAEKKKPITQIFASDKATRTESSTQINVPRKNKGQSKAAFRKGRQEIADMAFAEFDRVAFDGALFDVELHWSNKLRTTAGLTRLKQVSGGGGPTRRTATIELSMKIIDEEHRLRSTLLHEMCHAAAWLVDGVSKPPHGKIFQKWASIAMGQVPDVMVTTKHDYEISYKYAWACTSSKCGAVIQRHSRSVDIARHCCGKCKSRLVEIEVPSSQQGGKVEHTPRKKAPPSAYNLFVKQHSKAVRERLTSDRERQGVNSKVTQPEVMKECARLWREKDQA